MRSQGRQGEDRDLKNLPFTQRIIQQRVGSDYFVSAGLITGMTSRAGM